MTKYMLDTNAVSCAIRGSEPLVERVVSHRPGELCISAITVAELRFGADRSRSRRLHQLIDTILRALHVAPFDHSAATHFGHVAAALAAAGTPIGLADTLIASHALALGATIVTKNVKHFTRVSGLSVEDWS